jgi:hypothetical protein
MPQADEQGLNIEYLLDESHFSVYTNRVEINISTWDVRIKIMEILEKDGGALKIKKHGSVVMTPLHAKALLRALDSTLKQYEERFGEIDLGKIDKPLVSA